MLFHFDNAAAGPGGKPRIEALIRSPAAETNAEISPDGRWLAYQSDESGQYQIRIPANKHLELAVEDVLFRRGRPSRKPLVRYKSFKYQAASWTRPDGS